MDSSEQQLFSLLDQARTDRGCTSLRRNSNLTVSARADADRRAGRGNLGASGSSMAAAGGDNWDARTAFNRMMDQNSGTVLNCGLGELGIGRRSAPHCTAISLLGFCIGSTVDRVSWVADFR